MFSWCFHAYFTSFIEISGQPPPPLRMANVYGDHMILQQAPAKAIIWGYVTECDSKLTAKFGEEALTPTSYKGW